MPQSLRLHWGSLFWRGRSIKAAESRRFVGLDVENREEARDLHNVTHTASEIEEFELAFGGFDGAVGDYKLADSRAIDVVDVLKIEDDLGLALIEQILHHAAQDGTTFTKRNLPAEVDHRDIANLSACAAKNHLFPL